MKVPIALASTLSLCVLAACQQPGPKAPVANEVCKGVNAMIGQEISAKYDISTARSVALKISAAAEADVAKLKGLKEAKVDAGTEAKLGTEIKAVVETKSKVTTDFFQQDQSFAQAACFVDSILSRSDLSGSDRDFFESQRRALATNRVAYLDVLTGLKKN